MIYFLRAEQDSESLKVGWIKIGTSARLSERLRQISLEIGHTPTVLAVLDGSYAEERALHEKFSFAREWCEWFSPQAGLLRLIETEARPWDSVDEAPKRPKVGTFVRVSDEFAEAIKEASSLEKLSVADFATAQLLPVVTRRYRDTLVSKAKKAEGKG